MNRKLLPIVPLALVLTAGIPLITLAGGAGQHDHSTHESASKAEVTTDIESPAPTGDEAVIAEQLPTYPLSVCPVSGKELGKMGEPANHVYEGRLVRFCCSMCEGQFNEDPAAYVAKIDAAVIEAQLPTYPLTVCPVSGKELGGMGEPYDHVHGTRLVRFCCGMCLDSFNEDPAAHLAKIDAAAIAASEEAE
jgi:YHS domain-containing protein